MAIAFTTETSSGDAATASFAAAAAAAVVPAEFVACVVATQVGARLFPVAVSKTMPKHMLPIGGIPLLFRLLASLETMGFVEAVLVIHSDDAVTTPAFLGTNPNEPSSWHPYKLVRQANTSAEATNISGVDTSDCPLVLQSNQMKVTLVTTQALDTVDAMRHVEQAGVMAPSSQVVVMPGDLLLLDPMATALRDMIHAHRQRAASGGFIRSKSAPSAACTVLLTDVGALDEKGLPLKESAKQKKGLLSRDEEEIDYMAVTSDGQLVWKQPKLDVEDDKEMVGSTPKLVLPKLRLFGSDGGTRIRTEWNDVHCYILAPWVRRLLVVKPTLQSIRYDVIPLLIARQFRGAESTFGSAVEQHVVQEALHTFAGATTRMPLVSTRTDDADSVQTPSRHEYRVYAHITDNTVVRVNSVATYLYANREFMHAVTNAKDASTLAPHSSLDLPSGASFNPKFQSIVLSDCTVADKVTFKSSVVGRHCRLGANCRLNNVVLHDHVTIGDQAILQNTVVGAHCNIGDQCNLNDCHVSAGTTIAAGTKAKGEAFTSDSN